jgi:hypothetical protein
MLKEETHCKSKTLAGPVSAPIYQAPHSR